MVEIKQNKSPSLLDELLKVPDNSPTNGAQFDYAGKITALGIETQLAAGRVNSALQERVVAIDGQDVVDLGCGRRCPFQALIDSWCPNSRIISVDLDQANFTNFQGSFRNREFRLDDAQHLATISDSSVGVVFENLLFNDNHSINASEVLEQVRRVLVDGGVFVQGIGFYFVKIDGELKGPYHLHQEEK